MGKYGCQMMLLIVSRENEKELLVRIISLLLVRVPFAAGEWLKMTVRIFSFALDRRINAEEERRDTLPRKGHSSCLTTSICVSKCFPMIFRPGFNGRKLDFDLIESLRRCLGVIKRKDQHIEIETPSRLIWSFFPIILILFLSLFLLIHRLVRT